MILHAKQSNRSAWCNEDWLLKEMINRREWLTALTAATLGSISGPLMNILHAAAAGQVEPATHRTRSVARYEEMQFGVSYLQHEYLHGQ